MDRSTATKEVGVEILVSETTYGGVESMFQSKPLGGIPIRGRAHAVEVYGVEILKGA